jgi:hypothetical protein
LLPVQRFHRAYKSINISRRPERRCPATTEGLVARQRPIGISATLVGVLGAALWFSTGIEAAEPRSISGIYPHLAMFNQESECGTGAVVPWAGRKGWISSAGDYV